MGVIDQITVLRDEMANHPWLPGWQKTLRVTIRDHWQEVGPDELVVCSGDLTFSHVRRWLEQRQPAVYLARGYLGNHLYKQRLWWRACANSWANLTLKTPPFERWNKLNLERHPWKVHQVKRILIAPSKMTTPYWTGESPDEWARGMVEKFPGAEVRIRPKTGKAGARWATLWEDLDWCDMVVSQSSAITVEALWWGKKALSTEPCPTWAAGERVTLDNWQDPSEPEFRASWHEHTAWSQYSNEEWANGGALRMFSFYAKSIRDYQSPHQFQFHH